MWEETLRKIDYALMPAIAAVLWSADDHSLQFVSDGINVVYRFEVNSAGRYLRITHPKIRGKKELAAAIDYLKHLSQHEAPVCSPVISNAGNYIEEVQQGDFTFLVHATNEMPGHVIDLNSKDKLVYEKWGKAIAKLHLVASTYQPDSQFHFLSWKDLWSETEKYIKKGDEIIKKEFHQIDAWLKSLTQSSENFGLMHGDHRAGNVLWDGRSIHIIDFDEPVYHWFEADIARPFLELCERPFDVWQERFKWYIEGYKSIRAIDDEQIRNLSWFIRMKNLDMYIWTKYNWFDDKAPGGESREEWLKKRYEMIANAKFSVTN